MTKEKNKHRWTNGSSLSFFFLGSAIALPWIALNVYEHFVAPLSMEATNLVYFIAISYTLLLLALLWKASQDAFNSLANIVRGMRHGDFSHRAASYGHNDPICVLHDEINMLAEAMLENRLAQTEETYLLQNLIDKLDMAVAVLDENRHLSIANPAFGRLFGKPIKELTNANAEQLCLTAALQGESESAHWLDFPARSSRFMIHRTEFRHAGRAQILILLSDLKNPLREEERTAWKRLIRVMGHELNNSLTPIISLTQSLKGRVPQMGLPEEKAHSLDEALGVIGNRATHLNHFMQDYSRLAKLPEPKREAHPLAQLISHVAELEDNPRTIIDGGPECVLNVDAVQVENLLINIIKNAFEAIDGNDGHVHISWKRQATEVTLWVDDDGPGIAGTENLFVPFYSTKPQGSGIGLILSREIAEANGGSLVLTNRPEGGCRATITLPLTVSN